MLGRPGLEGRDRDAELGGHLGAAEALAAELEYGARERGIIGLGWGHRADFLVGEGAGAAASAAQVAFSATPKVTPQTW
jgi:hypothetical protein